MTNEDKKDSADDKDARRSVLSKLNDSDRKSDKTGGKDGDGTVLSDLNDSSRS